VLIQPIDLFVGKQTEVYQVKEKVTTKIAVLRVKKEARSSLIRTWKERLSLTEKGE